METGFRGTFVIPWTQIAVDGIMSPPLTELRPGMGWLWTGDATRVDGPESVLSLGTAEGETALRNSARLNVRRMFGKNIATVDNDASDDDRPLFRNVFTITNGRTLWTVTLIGRGAGRLPLLMFHDAIPPKDTVLWVVKVSISAAQIAAPDTHPGGVICFTPGTDILTPNGPRDIASLMEGDTVQTQDNGPAEILWIGRRIVSGARMAADTSLRPIRLREGALDRDVPDTGLLVSPDHRIVLRGARARTLFNADEVLVTARDLINDHTVTRAHGLSHVTYIHMLLGQHEIVFANNVPTESFHPASASLGSLRPAEQARLLRRVPQTKGNPLAYGAYARRLLTDSDAAILQADGGRRLF